MWQPLKLLRHQSFLQFVFFIRYHITQFIYFEKQRCTFTQLVWKDWNSVTFLHRILSGRYSPTKYSLSSIHPNRKINISVGIFTAFLYLSQQEDQYICWNITQLSFQKVTFCHMALAINGKLPPLSRTLKSRKRFVTFNTDLMTVKDCHWLLSIVT